MPGAGSPPLMGSGTCCCITTPTPATVRQREADTFAAELLLPRHRMLAEPSTRLRLPRSLVLQQTWGVSLEALLYRGR